MLKRIDYYCKICQQPISTAAEPSKQSEVHIDEVNIPWTKKITDIAFSEVSAVTSKKRNEFRSDELVWNSSSVGKQSTTEILS